MTSKTNSVAATAVSRFGARYDALGRRIETTRSGSAFAQNFVSDYQYDLLGQLTKDERFAGEVPGDPAAKLEAQSFGFLYDGIGNRLSAQKGTDTTAYTPNALNQYTSIGGMEPVHDADGNLVADGNRRFVWDAENRLILVEPIVASEGSKRLEFKYDYIGRRVSKQVWTRTGGTWVDEQTTAFVYDGWNLIEEISTSSHTASINHYTWGIDLSGSLQGAGGVGGLLSVVWTALSSGDGLEENNGGDDNNASAPQAGLSQEASGSHGPLSTPLESPSQSPLLTSASLTESGVTGLAGNSNVFHYTFDLNGNVSEVLDDTGTIASHYEYGPFGETLVEYFSPDLRSSISNIRFSTKYYDTELKTYYYGYRYYDPSQGRWLNRDPIEEQGGLNLYGFVGNDAVNRWDLLGMRMNLGQAQSLANQYSKAGIPPPQSTWNYSNTYSGSLSIDLEQIKTALAPKGGYGEMKIPVGTFLKLRAGYWFIDGKLAAIGRFFECCKEEGGIGKQFEGSLVLDIRGGLGFELLKLEKEENTFLENMLLGALTYQLGVSSRMRDCKEDGFTATVEFKIEGVLAGIFGQSKLIQEIGEISFPGRFSWTIDKNEWRNTLGLSDLKGQVYILGRGKGSFHLLY